MSEFRVLVKRAVMATILLIILWVILVFTVFKVFAGPPILVSPDGKYLGTLSADQYDPDSVSNPHGRYGSEYSSDSINNPYGQYGSQHSNDSANNPYATNPPIIIHRAH